MCSQLHLGEDDMLGYDDDCTLPDTYAVRTRFTAYKYPQWLMDLRLRMHTRQALHPLHPTVMRLGAGSHTYAQSLLLAHEARLQVPMLTPFNLTSTQSKKLTDFEL